MKKPISITARRKRTCKRSTVTGENGNLEEHEVVTEGRDTYALITEYVDAPSAQQDLALEIFWRALLAGLRSHIVERAKAA